MYGSPAPRRPPREGDKRAEAERGRKGAEEDSAREHAEGDGPERAAPAGLGLWGPPERCVSEGARGSSTSSSASLPTAPTGPTGPPPDESASAATQFDPG